MKHLSPMALAFLGAISAQTPDGDAQLHLVDSATRAEGNFRVADSLEARLNGQGLALRAQIVTLRLRIQAALDEARSALKRGDTDAAGEALRRTDAMLDRFARLIGGD